MRIGDTFQPADRPSEMSAPFGLSVDCLLLCMTSPLFGHPLQAATHARLPVAVFDWSTGPIKPGAGDLLIGRHATVEMTEPCQLDGGGG